MSILILLIVMCKLKYINSFCFTFADFNPIIASNLLKLGYETPLPIQKRSINSIISGQSCILHAETGSGKTLG